MKKGYISNPVISRMPRYYRCIDELYHEKCVRVSSAVLAERLGLTASQVRQDFSCFGEFGQQGYGYNVETLREEIANILGLPIQNSIIIVGCGNLGHALLKNFDFSACGMSLVGAFDVSPDLIGQQIGSYIVADLANLPEVVNQYHPEIAVLCVPRTHAQSVAEHLTELGIRGIWNFTNHELNLPSDIKVENVVFQDSLLLLGYKINEGKVS
jgi:redox-sensing transcriptional repressor